MDAKVGLSSKVKDNGFGYVYKFRLLEKVWGLVLELRKTL
jgi:hypothetical protein